jgi:hypothetical protein
VTTILTLTAGALRLRQAATKMPPSALSADLRGMARRFNLVVDAECVAIIAAADIVARSGHSHWIPAVICGAVGVHFVPLARLFSVRMYYATARGGPGVLQQGRRGALGLSLVAASTMSLGATGAPPSLWQLLPGFGTALVLWATIAHLLATTA